MNPYKITVYQQDGDFENEIIQYDEIERNLYSALNYVIESFENFGRSNTQPDIHTFAREIQKDDFVIIDSARFTYQGNRKFEIDMQWHEHTTIKENRIL